MDIYQHATTPGHTNGGGRGQKRAIDGTRFTELTRRQKVDVLNLQTSRNIIRGNNKGRTGADELSYFALHEHIVRYVVAELFVRHY